MDKSFYIANRQRFASSMRPGSVAVLLAGQEIRKTNDEYYPFFAQRNFVYLTGIHQKNSVLVICKDSACTVSQRLYILPNDAMAERWTGRRLTGLEAEEISGVSDIRYQPQFLPDLKLLALSGAYENLYLDLYRYSPDDMDTPAACPEGISLSCAPERQPHSSNLTYHQTALRNCGTAAGGEDYRSRHPGNDESLQARHVRIPV